MMKLEIPGHERKEKGRERGREKKKKKQEKKKKEREGKAREGKEGFRYLIELVSFKHLMNSLEICLNNFIFYYLSDKKDLNVKN